MITRDFDLWITQGHTKRLVFNANQYDSGETWRFRILGADGNPIVPTTAAIIGQKKDGHAILVQGTVSDGKVVITETEQMTACAGLTEFELLLNGETHGTANFTVQVEKRPGDDADLSDSDLSLIQDAVDAAEIITEVIGDGDPSEVIGEHVDAWLDNHPEATTTVEDGAITAPKINQSLWDKLLVSEEASGAVASFDDGADDVPVSSLKVALEPIQTGTGDPSPSNVRPIIAANGKNMMPSGVDGTYTKNGITCIAKNGIYKLTGTSTAITDIQIPLTESADLTPTNKKLAFLNTENNGNSLSVDLYRDSTRVHYWTMNSVNRVASGWTDTGNETINKIVFHVSSGVTVNSTISPMLMLLSDDDYSYQPYQGIMVDRKGRNLLPPFVVNVSWENGNATVVGTGDGAYKFNGTTTGYQQLVIQSDIYLKAGTYTFGATVEASGTPMSIGVQLRNVSGGITYATASWASPAQTFTLAEDTAVRIRFVVPSALTFNNVIIKPQIELGNTATTYEPYQSTSYPYSLGQSVYGGSVDLATGVLTVDRAVVTLNGSETWGAGSTNQGFYTSAHTMLKASDYTSVILCDKLKTYERMNKNDYYGATNGITGYIDGSNQYPTLNWIYAKGGGATTSAEFKTWLASNPLQVVYKLATPQTIQLTPTEVKTLLGYNNISSTGTVDVIYHADTKLYVDKMTAVDNNIIAPTEADFVATRNYTVNDLLIIADTLYKVTANIATGSAIIPNSNVTQTTLGALIKALS